MVIKCKFAILSKEMERWLLLSCSDEKNIGS